MKRHNNQIFIENAKKIHGDKYDYSKILYKNAKTKIIIICQKHGEFLQKPNNHLSGQGCFKCGVENACKLISSNTEKFIKKSKDIHGDKYYYSKVKYKNDHTKVIIICKKHGEYLQTPNNHLHNRGCPKCGKEKVIGGYNNKFFTVFPEHKNLDSHIYLIRLYNNSEEFYKIGISLNAEKRKCQFPREYRKDLIVCQKFKLYKSFQMEQKLLKDFKTYKYIPTSRFRGYTECFKFDKNYLHKIVNIMEEI